MGSGCKDIFEDIVQFIHHPLVAVAVGDEKRLHVAGPDPGQSGIPEIIGNDLHGGFIGVFIGQVGHDRLFEFFDPVSTIGGQCFLGFRNHVLIGHILLIFLVNLLFGPSAFAVKGFADRFAGDRIMADDFLLFDKTGGLFSFGFWLSHGVPSFCLKIGHKNARELLFPGADGTIFKDDRLAPSAGMIAALCVGAQRAVFI